MKSSFTIGFAKKIKGAQILGGAAAPCPPRLYAYVNVN